MSGSPSGGSEGLIQLAILLVHLMRSLLLWLIPWAAVALLGWCFFRILRFLTRRSMGLTEDDSGPPSNAPSRFDEMANIAISRRPRKRKHRHQHHNANVASPEV
jgi:hypothetical protein